MVVTGVVSSTPVKLVVQLSSPIYNATANTLAFFGTRVGPTLPVERLIRDDSKLSMSSVQVFVDSLASGGIFSALEFGSQAIFSGGLGEIGGIVFDQVLNFASGQFGLSVGESGSDDNAVLAGEQKILSQLQQVSQQVQQIMNDVTASSSQITVRLVNNLDIAQPSLFLIF